ncbi:MAG TPA: hypothetical protein VKR30_08820 [Candidatus Limnocylindrales bacterium]|nr:hypothetical protein [Candidatus Limnocylindrales bacterium]
MRPGSIGWWAAKVRQARRHLGARVDPAERAGLATWLSPAELAIFAGMHVSDQRHGLDVVASLRAEGAPDHDLLVAGLLHDAGKGDTGFVPRVVYSLSTAYGAWIAGSVAWLPGMAVTLRRLRDHAEVSAGMAAAAGCSPRTVELIRWQEEPHDPVAGERLRLADDAN